jgi:hypothetical protein
MGVSESAFNEAMEAFFRSKDQLELAFEHLLAVAGEDHPLVLAAANDLLQSLRRESQINAQLIEQISSMIDSAR